MTITARFASQCPKCRGQIAEGTKVEWVKGSKATHIACPTMSAQDRNDYEVFQNEGKAREQDMYLSEQEMDRDDAAYMAWIQFQANKPVARIAVEDAGVYVLPNGDVVKVQGNREKTRTYAKRWTVADSDRLAANGEHVKGEYVYEAGLVQEVAAYGRKMSLEEAKAFILQYGQCVRCGRKLKDGKSVERALGPVCVTYFSEGTTGAALMVGAA